MSLNIIVFKLFEKALLHHVGYEKCHSWVFSMITKLIFKRLLSFDKLANMSLSRGTDKKLSKLSKFLLQTRQLGRYNLIIGGTFLV